MPTWQTEIATNLGQVADFVAVDCTRKETERTLSNTTKCETWIQPPGARYGHQSSTNATSQFKRLRARSFFLTFHAIPRAHSSSTRISAYLTQRSGSFSGNSRFQAKPPFEMPRLADVHGTNAGDNKFPQQSALSGTANSFERHGSSASRTLLARLGGQHISAKRLGLSSGGNSTLVCSSGS